MKKRNVGFISSEYLEPTGFPSKLRNGHRCSPVWDTKLLYGAGGNWGKPPPRKQTPPLKRFPGRAALFIKPRRKTPWGAFFRERRVFPPGVPNSRTPKKFFPQELPNNFRQGEPSLKGGTGGPPKVSRKKNYPPGEAPRSSPEKPPERFPL